MTFIQRDFNRPESDDFKLRVQDQLRKGKEALPIYDPNSPKDKPTVLGWQIQNRYE